MSKLFSFRQMKYIVTVGLIVGLVSLVACSDTPDPVAPKYNTNLTAEEGLNASAFEKLFPNQYKTYRDNDQTGVKHMTDFGGPVAWRKNDNVNVNVMRADGITPEGFKHAQPYLKNLWLGYPFSYEYNKARGHTYAVHDILEIDRINNYSEKAGLPATCWNCKTPNIPKWVKENGDDKFWSMNFHDFRTKDKISMKDNSISCATCHDPKTMELVITSIPLNEALLKKGIDWKKASRNEMRSLVCAQCHVEYYFNEAKSKNGGIDKKPVFPWANGFDPQDMYEYYSDPNLGATKNPGFEGLFADWIHPVSKTPMLKAQHPEYETFMNGPHGAAGVACADCHMPYRRDASDNRKFSSHQWTSPLLDPKMAACRQCHSDKTPEFLKERVVNTQQKVYDQLMVAQDLSVKAHEAVRQALEFEGAKNEKYGDLIIAAQEQVRKGQFFWDLISAENSVGFHNPTKALNTLAESQQYSQNAINLAMQATNYEIGKTLEGDIKELVPPILKFSRELQMDPEFMQTHKWLKYLPVTPKAERVWNLQEKVSAVKQ
ncbi:ammonia-forming cytochrome c nitrite reductase subunit c552 [Desulfovibrio litoralis]|uniref:nitrite reductase (cytochrome; ammonia-forming) n=2 Tax=Desulfovibrio litoralis TaxID=466107 RepID=A0A1M7SET2_9BACT|nr:ammonia-forming cytochrome c nitrite reductase subunit c552 [Desulfovibrio litoralis]SHN56944.1 respiratory nitrite reductase (cytochrome ammonia-forming) precursor [Desulfovibrio litoralis DSM 11393]